MFLLSIMGCGLSESEVDEVEFVIEPRLDIDKNGYYHLELSRTTLQTIHRLSGHIYLNDEPYENVKFSWESSHFWTLGDTLGYIVQRGLTDSYEYVSYDTSYVIGFNDFIVPTVNCCSYSNSGGEVNTIFAPIMTMVDDTVTISVSMSGINEIFEIILD